MPEPEWDNVAFDGSWSRAAMGVTGEELGRLRPLARPVPAAGLVWRGLEARAFSSSPFVKVLRVKGVSA